MADCGACGKKVAKSAKALACDFCRLWYHMSCARLTDSMENSLKLESVPTLCRFAFLPADTTITRRVAATIEVALSVVHWKEYCFRGIKNNNILPAPQQLTREPL